ncbi:MAG: SMC-Scp complex subunit ScpB [Patescibacteria group bacterium]
MNDLDKHIEALLFLKGESMTVRELAKLLNVKEKEIKDTLDILEEKFSERGVRLVKKDESVMMVTASESSKFTKKLVDEEFNSELTRASLEVLTIVLYRNSVTRAEIDYIRGVNSSFIIRNLLIRGLVERILNPRDSRSYLYKPTFQLLNYLGVKDIDELPDRDILNKSVDKIKKENEYKNENSNNTNF